MKQITNQQKEQQDLMLANMKQTLIRAGKEARETAHCDGLSIPIMKDGKILAVKS